MNSTQSLQDLINLLRNFIKANQSIPFLKFVLLQTTLSLYYWWKLLTHLWRLFIQISEYQWNQRSLIHCYLPFVKMMSLRRFMSPFWGFPIIYLKNNGGSINDFYFRQHKKIEWKSVFVLYDTMKFTCGLFKAKDFILFRWIYYIFSFTHYVHINKKILLST